MTRMQLSRISGLGMIAGCAVFIAYVILRSFVTAGVDATVYATQGIWGAINALGVMGATLVLLCLPEMYASIAASTGKLGLFGVALIAIAWMFFGLFLSLYGMLILPWLAAQAPPLVAAAAPLPAGIIAAFIVGLIAWLVGGVLLALPFVRGRVRPRWVGYMLPASALWMVAGDLIIAPAGPASNLLINILSNMGPVLLLVALGEIGFQMWSEQALANQSGQSMRHLPG